MAPLQVSSITTLTKVNSVSNSGKKLFTIKVK